MYKGFIDTQKRICCPQGKYIRSFEDKELEVGHGQGIVNCLALNSDGVLVSGGEEGKLYFWDYDTGEIFQKIKTPIQPGSLECESQIFDCLFDMTETRLIVTGCDKTIKMFKQVDEEEDFSDEEESKDLNEKDNDIKNRLNKEINLNEDDDEEDSEGD